MIFKSRADRTMYRSWRRNNRMARKTGGVVIMDSDKWSWELPEKWAERILEENKEMLKEASDKAFQDFLIKGKEAFEAAFPEDFKIVRLNPRA